MDVTDLLNQCRSGVADAENRLIELYFKRVAEIADRQIHNNYKRIFDGEDIAVSVFRTVSRRIRNGEFVFEEEKHFWALLISVMQFKVYRQIEYWTAMMRNINRDHQQSGTQGYDQLPEVLQILISREPLPDEVVTLKETIENLLLFVGDQTKSVFRGPPNGGELLQACIDGKTHVEICSEVLKNHGKSISIRTVSKRMQIVMKNAMRFFEDAVR